MKKHMKHSINETSDIVKDAAILLQQVGVIEIDEHALDVAIHQTINVQDLINHAAGLFLNRRKQGLITLNQLLATVTEDAA